MLCGWYGKKRDPGCWKKNLWKSVIYCEHPFLWRNNAGEEWDQLQVVNRILYVCSKICCSGTTSAHSFQPKLSNSLRETAVNPGLKMPSFSWCQLCEWERAEHHFRGCHVFITPFVFAAGGSAMFLLSSSIFCCHRIIFWRRQVCSRPFWGRSAPFL